MTLADFLDVLAEFVPVITVVLIVCVTLSILDSVIAWLRDAGGER